MIAEQVDAEHVLSGPRGSELALLCTELALRARQPDASQAVADLREWCRVHAEVCPALAATLPQVTALLRARSGPRAQEKLAHGQTSTARSDRVNV